MLDPVLTDEQVVQWRDLVAHCHKAVVTAHCGPDGDAIGSSLALQSYLEGNGVDTTVIMPDMMPDFLAWLPNADKVIAYDTHKEAADKAVEECDTVFCLDFNDFERINELGRVLKEHLCTKVVIDHHLDPCINADWILSRPDLSSTCEVLFSMLWQLDYFDAMTYDEAVDIYCGMMTDTGGFTYNSSRPEIFFIISKLLEKGLDKDKIYRNVFNNYSRSRVRLTGYILYKKLHFYEHLRACYYTLTDSEMKHFNFKRGDAEGIVNMPLMVKGMRLSVSFREDVAKHSVRVSLRSVDDFPCNKMAADFFNGGGHLNASGGELNCSMEEAVKIMDKAVQAYAELL